jgi:Xaa-Pro aminopeptidase
MATDPATDDRDSFPVEFDVGDDAALIAEKTAQAQDALRRYDVDCWLTFARETTATPDPSLPLLLNFGVVWPTAVVVGPDESHVVLGRHDAPNARALGVHEVHSYDESIREALTAVMDSVGAERVGLNWDRDDATADGLSHGLYRRLADLLPDRELVGAGDYVGEVRGAKTETERSRIETAVRTTERLLADLRERYDPAWTERDVADHLRGRMDAMDMTTSWDRAYCPSVHAGGDSEVGHTKPGDRTVPAGELLHVDFGVRVAGYCADLQRMFYRPDDGAGAGAPAGGAREAFEAVHAAIDAGAATLEPGVAGHEVDAVAREAITDRGYDEYAHALGHQVGRHAHDGGTLLGPRWERYGDSVERPVRAGEVYTVELGVETEWGYVGGEEMVVVREDGAEWLSEPQRELWTLAG